jgi:hypothetical protein
VLLDDAVLPAAAHLTGPEAHRVLAAALDVAGGTLERARPCHLQYRPGHDVVVRFDGQVRWHGRPAVTETLLVATTAAGPPPGTLPVEATTPDGASLAVGVWRWPFDPVLVGLRDAVTPSACAALLAGLVDGTPHVEVVAYRPTLRAVARVTTPARTVYVKALPPADVPALVERHERLRAGGVPVPAVLRVDVARGLVAMAELAGPTIRDRLRSGRGPLPAVDAYEALLASIATVDLGPRVVPGRVASGVRHAAVLGAVLPAERGRLDALAGRLADATGAARARTGPTVHGDLHEGQLVTGRRRGARAITGLLDLDDAGRGDPLDDRATLIAHLVDRSLHTRGAAGRRVRAHAERLRDAFATRVDPAQLDLVTAGALTGLATGPLRLQHAGWPAAVARRLDIAMALATAPGEKTLSECS